jgi:hypothetical protein
MSSLDTVHAAKAEGVAAGQIECTSAFCSRPAELLVSWKNNPAGLPFCRECSDKLAAHGDQIAPLLASRPDREDS